MPQLNKGGKFVFGKSRVRQDGSLCLPEQAIEEYQICREGRVYFFTGAKATGGFCVTRKGLLAPSRLGHILRENPDLDVYALPAGTLVPYKGRRYGWLEVSPEGRLFLGEALLRELELAPGMELLCIRSSNIAFTMGARGPLLERAKNYAGEIPAY
ncbi:hypothetical protein D7X94_03760 [Acutalibacter sp. 1XD8-33]|uniref:hypothetical protein n=1 Tax=Acutalibacter sp. 1XD8-33 TaxID=2320081 RepID=UPI000EA02178|nr:hypothetical protein [Acutalibacter sp. 1XD8-33]RKJ41416.1 hypothetical protein D7X94_03760 [Acutalibacter sp. 1XD8-33]